MKAIPGKWVHGWLHFSQGIEVAREMFDDTALPAVKPPVVMEPALHPAEILSIMNGPWEPGAE
jgi:hypothetical protein